MHITQQELSSVFKKYVRDTFRTQREAAEYFKVSETFLSQCCRGLKVPNKAMRDAIV